MDSFQDHEQRIRALETQVAMLQACVKHPSSNATSIPTRKPATVEEVVTKGQFIGLDEQSCRDWYRDCEACGWLRGDGTPFDNWARQLVIYRDALRSRKPTGGAVNGNRPLSVLDLTKIIQVKEEKAKAIRDKWATEGPFGLEWSGLASKGEYFALRKEIRELKSKIEAMAV